MPLCYSTNINKIIDIEKSRDNYFEKTLGVNNTLYFVHTT
jgi:hypothetical protein